MPSPAAAGVVRLQPRTPCPGGGRPGAIASSDSCLAVGARPFFKPGGGLVLGRGASSKNTATRALAEGREPGLKHVMDIERNLGRIEEEVGGIRSGLDRINETLIGLEAVSGRLKECEDEIRITREGLPPPPRIGRSPAVAQVVNEARAAPVPRSPVPPPMPEVCPVELEGRNGYAAMVLCRMGYPAEFTVGAFDMVDDDDLGDEDGDDWHKYN